MSELVKGVIYVVEEDMSWMKGNLGEYHSTYPRECDEEPLHNMVFRDATGGLEMSIWLSKDILCVAPEGSELGDTVDLHAAGITVKGEGDGR